LGTLSNAPPTMPPMIRMWGLLNQPSGFVERPVRASVTNGDAVLEPLQVRIIRGGNIELEQDASLKGRCGMRIGPAMAFGMAVGEGDIGGAIMIAGGEIDHGESAELVLKVTGEVAVVDAVLPFVDQDEHGCRRRAVEVFLFAEGDEGVGLPEGVHADRFESVHVTIDGDGADTRQDLAGNSNGAFVAWTLKDAGGSQVRGELGAMAIARIHKPAGVDVVEAPIKIEPAADPTGPIRFQAGEWAMTVWHEMAAVIIGVELPSQVELAKIA
jgi:hypothetical protein